MTSFSGKPSTPSRSSQAAQCTPSPAVRETIEQRVARIKRLKAENAELRRRIWSQDKSASGASQVPKPDEEDVGSSPPAAPGETTDKHDSQSSLAKDSTKKKSPSLASNPHNVHHPSLALNDLRRQVEMSMNPTEWGQNGSSRDDTSTSGSVVEPQRLVFVASEVAPYSKSGGLADVLGSLPVAMAARGHRVMVVSPFYRTGNNGPEITKGLQDTGLSISIQVDHETHNVRLKHKARKGVDWVFIQHSVYERPGSLYGNENGAYTDNISRFTLLSLAACEAALQLALPTMDAEESKSNGRAQSSSSSDSHASHSGESDSDSSSKPAREVYGQEVVFIANDWHAGMVPVYLKYKYRPHGVFMDAQSILAIHNLAYQGTDASSKFPVFGLPGAAYSTMEWIYEETSGLRTPLVSVMKGALMTCDRMVTVSEHYAWEITQKSHGVGLHDLIQSRSHVLNGIVNGIDLDEWNPACDPHIVSNYDESDLSGKATCARALRRELGLPEARGTAIPLVAFVGRLDPQKGPDLVLDAIEALASLDCQVVMLASGDPKLEERMRDLGTQFPDFFAAIPAFSVPLAHRIMASCDILIMPSRFEPCGLNQLYAMRYGTVPVACATGGLNDTIDDVSPFTQDDAAMGTGWTFESPTVPALMRAMTSAVTVYRNEPARWKNIQREGMNQDFSWDRAASSYEQLVEMCRTVEV